jgi:hypothetical protein
MKLTPKIAQVITATTIFGSKSEVSAITFDSQIPPKMSETVMKKKPIDEAL